MEYIGNAEGYPGAGPTKTYNDGNLLQKDYHLGYQQMAGRVWQTLYKNKTKKNKKKGKKT